VLGGLYLSTFIKEEIMKLKLLIATAIDGTSFAKGEVIEADKELANKLIGMNKAIETKAKKKAKK
jgi:hypothetical protein